MKYTFTLSLLCLSFFAFAFEIQVKKMTRDGELERSYVLESSSLSEKVVLDCQSFVQGLRIGEQEEAAFFLMEPFECEAMQDRVRSSLKRRLYHCIDVQDEIRSDYSCSRN